MYCEKCGKEMDIYSEHTCVEQRVIPHRSNPNFQLPNFQIKTSSSYEMTYKAISPNAPSDFNLEEMLSNKSQLGGLLHEFKKIFSLWKNTFKKPSKGNIIYTGPLFKYDARRYKVDFGSCIWNI